MVSAAAVIISTSSKLYSSLYGTHSVILPIIILVALIAITFGCLTTRTQFVSGHHVLDEIDVPSRPMRLSISDRRQ